MQAHAQGLLDAGASRWAARRALAPACVIAALSALLVCVACAPADAASDGAGEGAKSGFASAMASEAGGPAGVPDRLNAEAVTAMLGSQGLALPDYVANATASDGASSPEQRLGALLAQIADERTEAAQARAARAGKLGRSAHELADQLAAEQADAEAEAARLKAAAERAAQEAEQLDAKAKAARKEAKLLARNPFAALGSGAGAQDNSTSMTSAALSGIPEDSGLASFSLVEGAVATPIDAKRERQIGKAVKAIEDAGYQCGFVLLDLASGKGLACNAGEAFYTASAFKAPMVYYMLQRDGGENVTDTDRAQGEAAIRQSSNGDYDALSSRQMGGDYELWLDGYEIRFDGTYYAYASAKSLARIWADLFQYLRSDAPDADWFAEQLSNTNRSFIRDALAGEGVAVLNKAGWIGDGSYSATTDCAYVDEAGRAYLVVVLSDQPDSEAASRRCADLSRALFAARDALV